MVCSIIQTEFEALMNSKSLEIPAYIIGALTAGGGTFGYLKTGSVPSIVAGLTVGTLVSVTLRSFRFEDTELF